MHCPTSPGASVATIRSNLGIIADFGVLNLGIIAVLGIANLGIRYIFGVLNLGIRYIFISFAPENIQITHDIQEKTIQRNAGVENQLQGQVSVAD
jgi:hypothetical protein